MRSSLKRLLFGLVCTYLVLCAVVFVLQRQLLYHPGPAPTRLPELPGLECVEVELETVDGELLRAWMIEPTKPQGCVLVSHGNAGARQHRVSLARAFAEMNCATLLYDYRGYGGSTGRPSEDGTQRDARAALGWLADQGWSEDRIVLWGESLGGGVATELATSGQFAGLVLDHTFTSAVDMGAALYPWLPVRWLQLDRYDNLDRMATTEEPLLILHSPDDRLIPFEHAERLHAAAPQGARLVRTSGGHNGPGFLGQAGFIDQVRRFFDDSLQGS